MVTGVAVLLEGISDTLHVPVVTAQNKELETSSSSSCYPLSHSINAKLMSWKQEQHAMQRQEAACHPADQCSSEQLHVNHTTLQP
jgi:hypothetical protein